MLQTDKRKPFGATPTGWLLSLIVLIGAAVFLTQTPTQVIAQEGAAPVVAPPAPAPVPAPVPQTSGTAVNPKTGELPNIQALFGFNVYINGAIVGLSVLATLLFLYFLASIRGERLAPASFVDDVNKLVIAGRYDDAANFCRAHRRLFVATVIQRCAENAGKTHSVIMEMLDAEGRRRADIIWNRVSYLADISNISPMLGLLGTVLGMMKAFFVLPEGSGNMRSTMLSQAIGEAMGTTMFGLIVAIVATVFYSIIKSRATRSLAQAEQAVHSVADRIKRGGE